ncbi:hypothetical protein B0T17DRAFT_12794 [Bombardia bombarda]|uniref:Uncharacterized protein n=1 Tax=Bombardia bombarda TaxID=252184 RepID=A0AA40CDW3_9PEZI|nr:hypothetical protein B0T17DRAFT_12794 [Bombardia bombarda]
MGAGRPAAMCMKGVVMNEWLEGEVMAKITSHTRRLGLHRVLSFTLGAGKKGCRHVARPRQNFVCFSFDRPRPTPSNLIIYKHIGMGGGGMFGNVSCTKLARRRRPLKQSSSFLLQHIMNIFLHNIKIEPLGLLLLTINQAGAGRDLVYLSAQFFSGLLEFVFFCYLLFSGLLYRNLVIVLIMPLTFDRVADRYQVVGGQWMRGEKGGAVATIGSSKIGSTMANTTPEIQLQRGVESIPTCRELIVRESKVGSIGTSSACFELDCTWRSGCVACGGILIVHPSFIYFSFGGINCHLCCELVNFYIEVPLEP